MSIPLTGLSTSPHRRIGELEKQKQPPDAHSDDPHLRLYKIKRSFRNS
ncbi:hypothetical protein HDE79_001838 [Rhodanobacter sp. MP1X3]|nr:hypothetical protein [Rhodanobacter sp. MP1X3]